MLALMPSEPAISTLPKAQIGQNFDTLNRYDSDTDCVPSAQKPSPRVNHLAVLQNKMLVVDKGIDQILNILNK